MKKIFKVLTLSLLCACGARPNYLDISTEGTHGIKLSEMTVTQFKLLPTKGEAQDKKKLWSGDYWAHKNGSINYRWNAEEKIGFNLYSPTKEEALTLNTDYIAQLSAAEKFDLFTGSYHYPLRNEVYQKANPDAKYWEGICDGWAPATMNHDEPSSKVVTNADGISIPFGSADIKALLSYYYAFEYQVANTQQVGRRCPRSNAWLNRDPDCREDLSAGTFHLILANKIGIEGRSFIADLERFKEVWNHPLISYQTKVLEESKKSVRVKTKIYYVDESNVNTWEPLIGTKDQIISTRDYEYTLELDDHGNIIGGDWKSNERPDFIWTKNPPSRFEGKMARLAELLN